MLGDVDGNTLRGFERLRGFIAAGVRGCDHAREKAADRQELAARTPLYPVLLHRARLHDGHAIVGHLGSTAERLESGSDELNLARVWRSSDVLDHLDRRVVVAVAPGYRLGRALVLLGKAYFVFLGLMLLLEVGILTILGTIVLGSH